MGLALVRIATGGVFVYHGWQTVFTAGVAGVARAYASAGVPLPLLVAPVTATLDLLGGLLLLLGLGARGLAGVLGVVTLLTGSAQWIHGGGSRSTVETAVLLVAGCAAVALGGAGTPAVDGRTATPGTFRTRGRR